MTHEELVSLIQTYGATEEKAREIAEKIKDNTFFIGKDEVEHYVLCVDVANIGRKKQ